MLQGVATPWVIENVPGSPMRADYILCGSMFALPIVRHRWFEVSWAPVMSLLPPCSHDVNSVSVVGHSTPSWVRKARAKRGLSLNPPIAVKRAAMGVDWMNRDELSLAVPPAYTEHIGRALMAALERVA